MADPFREATLQSNSSGPPIDFTPGGADMGPFGTMLGQLGSRMWQGPPTPPGYGTADLSNNVERQDPGASEQLQMLMEDLKRARTLQDHNRVKQDILDMWAKFGPGRFASPGMVTPGQGMSGPFANPGGSPFQGIGK